MHSYYCNAVAPTKPKTGLDKRAFCSINRLSNYAVIVDKFICEIMIMSNSLLLQILNAIYHLNQGASTHTMTNSAFEAADC